MDSVSAKVLAETERFRAALPGLKKVMPGVWVVFKDGAVVSGHGTEEEAYLAAMKSFGPEGGFVVGQIADEPPVPLTAGVVFGM